MHKTPLTYQEQLELLTKRGLIIENEEKALQYLKHIGYYRLSGYFKNFQSSNDEFKNTYFKDVVQLYVFDRKLRLLFLEAIERIEVSLRSTISDYICIKTNNPTWHIDVNNFYFFEHEGFSINDQFQKMTENFNDTIKQSKEIFIQNHTKKSPGMTPECWKLFNILSFGQISYIFTHLNRENKNAIAKEYNIDETLLQSWIITLSFIRNISAHHSQLWNKKLIKPVKIPNKFKEYNLNQHTIFSSILITIKLIKVINPNSTWKTRLQELVLSSPEIQIEKMGFPENWEIIINSI